MTRRCEKIEELLSLFVYEELSPGEMGRTGIHIGGCESCSRVHNELREVLEAADLYVVDPRPVDIDSIVREAIEDPRPAIPVTAVEAGTPRSRRFSLVAAAVILAAVIPLAIVAMREPSVSPTTTVVQEPDGPPPPIVVETPEPRPQPQPEAPSDSPVLARVEREVDPAAAAKILNEAAVRGRFGDPHDFRRRLAATGIEVDAVLIRVVREDPPHLARAAISILVATSPGRVVPVAGEALRDRPVIAEAALAALESSKDPRATAEIERAWDLLREARLAGTLAVRGESRDARALVDRIVRTDGGAPEVWDALLGMGPIATQPLVDAWPRLPSSRHATALAHLAATPDPRVGLLLRRLVGDPEHGAEAGRILARWGDPAAFDGLLATSSDVESSNRAALAELAQRRPEPFEVAVRSLPAAIRSGDEAATARALRAATVLGETRPERLAAIVVRLTRTSANRPAALELARAVPDPIVVRALLPLGADSMRAAGAVECAAALGEAGQPALVQFLATRHGSAAARNALVEQTGVDLGSRPGRWLSYLKR